MSGKLAWSATVMALACGVPSVHAEAIGTAAHERGRIPRYTRIQGDSDWARRGADVPAADEIATDWETMIARHRAQELYSERDGQKMLPTLKAMPPRRRSSIPLDPSEAEVRWTSGGFRPSRAYHKRYEEEPDRLAELLAQRIPSHMDPLDLRSREAFGKGIIEIGEAIKRAIAQDGGGLRKAFSGGPYEVRELVVKSRAPNFYPADYGVGYRFRMVLRGLYRSDQKWVQPLNFFLDADVLAGEDGLVRVDVRPDVDASQWGQAGAPPELDQYLLDSSWRVANAYGPLELQGIEARMRDLIRRVLPLAKPAPGRKRPNGYHQEVYVPIALKSGRWQMDLNGDGRPDEEFRIKNRTRRIERGPIQRGGRRRFDFQQYAGWELYRGETKILARSEGRLKFALYGDTDGDGLPDLILVEDRGEKRISHLPYEPAHQYYLRPAVYFLDGQDMARDVFALGPVRFDFPPGADGSEIRSANLVPRMVNGRQMDWDVQMEIFDPEGRIIKSGLVFDRFPSNHKEPEQIGFQRAEFEGRTPGRSRGVRFRVHFSPGSDSLDKEALKEIQKAWAKVGAGSVEKVRLIGHACNQGTYQHNLELGKRRARAVARCLADFGVRPHRVTVDSRGEYEPVGTNSTKEGSAMNRRVDAWMVVRPAPADRPPWYGRVGYKNRSGKGD